MVKLFFNNHQGLFMKLFAALATSALMTVVSPIASATSLYFVAHADDVELFMARNAIYDVKSGAKTVFVVVTTGSFIRHDPAFSCTSPVDVQADQKFPGSPYPYYLIREEGHIAALRNWYSLRGLPVGSVNKPMVTIDGKAITRAEIGGIGSNVIMYNLRLIDGDACSQTGLAEFRKKALTNPSAQISTLDGHTFTWESLKSFVRALIIREQDGSDTWVNTPEYWEDGVPRPYDDDHRDHIETARVVHHALQGYSASSPARCIRSIQWMGYHSATQPINYTVNEQTMQDNAWLELNRKMVEMQGPDTNNAGHRQFLFRIYSSANGIGKFGPCP
jgi:hypothetical protein